jgi:hypothetical protein
MIANRRICSRNTRLPFPVKVSLFITKYKCFGLKFPTSGLRDLPNLTKMQAFSFLTLLQADSDFRYGIM